MALRLLTEADARAEWSGDLLIIRQQRIAFEDLGVMFLKTIVVALVTLPLWQGLFVEAAWIPYWLALLLALAGGAYSYVKGKDLQAARQKGAWLIVTSRKRIWVHFRSYLFWHWPDDSPTVLAIDATDIDHLVPVRMMDGTPAQLRIELKEEMPGELAEFVLDENYRMARDKAGRLLKHAPLVIEEDLKGLRVRWNGELPSLREVCDKLRLNYQLEAPMRMERAEDNTLAPRGRLTDADLEEVNAFLRAGDAAAAVRLLVARSGMSKRDAQAMIAGAGWQEGAAPAPESSDEQPH